MLLGDTRYRRKQTLNISIEARIPQDSQVSQQISKVELDGRVG